MNRHPKPTSNPKGTLSQQEIDLLQNASAHIETVAGQIPPLSPQQLHTLTRTDRISQHQLLQQADRYLLALSLLLPATLASLAWHFSPSIPFLIALIPIVLLGFWSAQRAARCLWYRHQSLRHRHDPCRMAVFADRLQRLMNHRQHWTRHILRMSQGPSHTLRPLYPRIPSYAIACCLFISVCTTSLQTLSITHPCTYVATTSRHNSQYICNDINTSLLNIQHS